MNQWRSAAGLESAEVQLTSTLSPNEYRSRPPFIVGPPRGNAEKTEKNFNLVFVFWHFIDLLS